ncbi:hypothetical protein BN341_5080 [Helicobacter heilmannii ASB1.4]|nr:hypothetical protein BN341_5080 [Helicobacter heilmannii ASB1.4]
MFPFLKDYDEMLENIKAWSVCCGCVCLFTDTSRGGCLCL